MLSAPADSLQPCAPEQKGSCSLSTLPGQDGASLTAGPKLGPTAAVLGWAGTWAAPMAAVMIHVWGACGCCITCNPKLPCTEEMSYWVLFVPAMLLNTTVKVLEVILALIKGNSLLLDLSSQGKSKDAAVWAIPVPAHPTWDSQLLLRTWISKHQHTRW